MTEKRSIKLAVYNIEYCQGMTGEWWKYLEFWKILKAPKKLNNQIIESLNKYNLDILGLVEVDTGSIRANKINQVKYFSKQLNMNNSIEKIKYPYQSWLKLFHYIPILKNQANSIISKYKLEDVKYHLLNNGTKRVVIESTININNNKVTLLLVHLALGKKTRTKQIKDLIKIVNNIDNPVILMGDLNTFNGKKEITNLLKETHLEHKFELDELSPGLTQPTFKPSRRLDYILTSKKIKVKKYNILNFDFSDHLPVYVEFEI